MKPKYNNKLSMNDENKKFFLKNNERVKKMFTTKESEELSQGVKKNYKSDEVSIKRKTKG